MFRASSGRRLSLLPCPSGELGRRSLTSSCYEMGLFPSLSLSGSDLFVLGFPMFLLWKALLRGFFSHGVRGSRTRFSLFVCPLQVPNGDFLLGSPFGSACMHGPCGRPCFSYFFSSWTAD